MNNARPSGAMPGLPAPLSEMPWSADFVMQAIEVLPVMLDGGQIVSLRPDCADSFVLGWPAGARPEEVAAQALQQLGLNAIILHSTSWRHAGSEVVLTYIAVVSPTCGLPPSWEAGPARHTELARGDATTPPPSIGVEQVLEHALRHLAWLVQDDPVVATELADWRGVLASYVPEPFRAFAGLPPPP